MIEGFPSRRNSVLPSVEDSGLLHSMSRVS
jgi:hypothetical protein